MIKKRHNKQEDLQEIFKSEFVQFYEKFGRYPSILEIDSSGMFTFTGRTIQRRLGGIEKFRESIGLEVTNMTRGETRSKIAIAMIQKSNDDEIELHKYLTSIFGQDKVHCHEPYEFDSKKRTFSDFGIYTPTDHFFADIFYASHEKSIQGCIRWKKTKIKTNDPVFLVCTNNEFSTDFLKKYNQDNVQVMNLHDFNNYCYLTYKNVIE